MLSDRTRGIVGDAEVRAMKPNALLVNTSRGPVVEDIRAWTGGSPIRVLTRLPLSNPPSCGT